MHPSLVLLIVAGGMVAMGASWAVLSRALRSPLEPHWPRTIGHWQPWQPLRRQRIHFVVDGVVHVAYDGSSRSWPRQGTADVRYDPADPSRAVVDGEVGPGTACLIVAVASWVVAGVLLVVAAALPWIMAQLEAASLG